MNLHFNRASLKADTIGFTSLIWLTSAYLTFSILWILLSDSLAIKLAGNDAETLQQLQQFKGIFFVILSGALLFYFGRRSYRNLTSSFEQKESLEKRFHALNEAAREGIFDCNLENMTADINSKMRFFLPRGTGTIEDFWRVFQKRINPMDTSRLAEEYNNIVLSNRSVWQSEYRLLGSDNKYYSIVSSIYILRNPETGKPTRLIGTILDISELRNLQAEQYEQQLKHKQELTASIIRAQENERNRWAEELHDNVCQLLAVARLYLGEMEKRPGTTGHLLPEVKTLVADAMNDIRQLSASIKPPSFSKTTLENAIEKLTSDINRVKAIRFHIEMDKLNETMLCDEQKLLVYRVVQEQLNNIVKYANAKNVVIHCSRERDKFMIRIKDDGRGFDPENIKSGIGLRNIQTRLQHYKGNMKIESSPGHGCTLSAVFTVTNELMFKEGCYPAASSSTAPSIYR